MNSNFNTNIVELIENEPRISHRVIAEQTQIQAQNIKELIDDNLKSFELFGLIRFETEKGNGRPKNNYYLNEQQATLLISMMRNNDIVLDFKVRLVKEFFRMRELLQNQKSQPQTQIFSIPELTNETEQITELKNHVLETSNLIEILESKKPTTLYRLDKFYRKTQNFSPIETFEIDLKNQFFLPTELGKMINKSAVEVNLMIEKKGLQIRENRVWKMTSSGEEFGIEIVGKFSQIKWKMKTIIL